MQESRKFTRVPFHSNIMINANGKRIKGESENLSLYGLFVKVETKPEVNCSIQVMIPLTQPGDQNYMGLNGIVARQAENGIGIKFHQIDVDTFLNIKNIVSSSSGSESKIMAEFYNYISYK